MAKFVFKLQAVLRQRTLVEREKQRELASCRKVLNDLHDALHDLNDRAQATSDDLRRNHLLGKLDMSFLTAHRRYMLAAFIEADRGFQTWRKSASGKAAAGGAREKVSPQ